MGLLYHFLHVLWYEYPFARNLIITAKRSVTLIAFLKFCSFLVNWWTNKTYQILEISAWHYKKNSGNTIAFPHSLQNHHSVSPPVVQHRLVFFICSMLASLKNASFFLPLDTCNARNIKPSAAIHIFSSSSFSLKYCLMYSLNCMCPLNVVRKKHCNIEKMRFVGCVWTVVSLFCLCLVSVWYMSV